MDTGTTFGTAAKHDIETMAMEDTGQPSSKVFMLPDKSKIQATHKMLLTHNLWEWAREMNVVPVPKMADADYIAVFDKNKDTIYDAMTPTITSLANPVVVAPQFNTTGIWKLAPDTGDQDTQNDKTFRAIDETVNTIFDLPNN
jgi:hypothetical protein